MHYILPSYFSHVTKYLIEIRAQGRYSFTTEELKNQFILSPNALKKILYRLKQKKEIALVSQGFYVIIPPEYSKQGIIPPYLYINDLMKSLEKSYYVGLLSAAALLGAVHQQPAGYTIITQSPSPRSINKLKILFFSTQKFVQDGIVQRKTPAGYINMSSPELTALDFFDNIHKFGINRITAILRKLSKVMKPATLLKIAKQYPNMAAIQRLGYVLDKIFAEKLSNALWKVLSEKDFYPIPLSPQKDEKGETNNKWKIIQNIEIESNL